MRSFVTRTCRDRRGAFLVCLALTGCGGPGIDPAAMESLPRQVEEIRQATANPMTPEQVGEAYALGSKATDLQRELIEKKLVGSVVEWNLTVYEVDVAEGVYKVTSQPIKVSSADAVQLLRVVALVQAQGAADDELMRTIQTDDAIRIRGRVQGIVLRTIVEIWPAVVKTAWTGGR